MLKQVYHWQRFWCPRSSHINLTDGGYLYNPETKWGKAYNSELVSFEEIADVPCLVLLGEPGIGKSQELKNLKLFTEKEISNTNQVLELNLRSCTDLKDELFKHKIFADWLEGCYHLYFFLDSLDEGLLNIPTLATGLIEVLDTGLFSSRGSNRMGWAHQTYAEFLAAWYLKQHNLNLDKILNLIIHPDNRVIPQLQETVAWLASMIPEVFQEIVKTDPDVLLQSDL